MPRFFGFVKGWVARTLPELMPQGSLQRCRDLNMTVLGGLRTSRELVEVTNPSGVTSSAYQTDAFFQFSSGSSTLTYIVRGGELYRDKNNLGFVRLSGVTNSSTNYNDYTLYDPQSEGTVTVASSSRVSATNLRTWNYNMTSDIPVTLYRNIGDSSYFQYQFDFITTGVSIRAQGKATDRACAHLWATNDGPIIYGVGTGEKSLSLEYHSSLIPSGTSWIMLRQLNGKTFGPYYYTACSVSTRWSSSHMKTRYYATLTYDSSIGSYGRLTCALYTNSTRTTLATTLTLNLGAWYGGAPSLTYNFLLASVDSGWDHDPDSWDTGLYFGKWSGDVANFKSLLGSAGSPTEATFAVMTPSVATKKYIYIGTSAGLFRDCGMYKFKTGTTWLEVGLPIPSGMSSCWFKGAGNFSSTVGFAKGDVYKVAYTYYDSETGAESEPSGTSTITLPSGVISTGCSRLKWKWQTGLTAGHADKVRLYRSINNGGTLFYVGSVTISRAAATGTSTNGVPDSYLGDPVGDVGRPPTNATTVQSWRGRLWTSGSSWFDGVAAHNRVYYSRNLLPEVVPPDYYVQVQNTDEVVKALAVYEGSLYILTDHSIYEVEGTTSDSFKLSDQLTDVGTVSGRSVASGREGIFFVGRDGIYLFNGRVEESSEQVKWLFDESGDKWTSALSPSDLTSSKGAYIDNRYYCTIGNQTIIYDASSKAFRSRTKPFSCFWANPSEGYLYTGASISSKSYHTIYRMTSTGETGVSRQAIPEFITKPEYITQQEDKGIPRIGHVSRFKTYCKGFWTFYFYCDEVLAHTQTGTTYSGASRNISYNLPADIKGTILYIRGISSRISGSTHYARSGVTPGSTCFYSMEVW